MPGIKISSLQDGGSIQNIDDFPIARGNLTRKIKGSIFLDKFAEIDTKLEQLSSDTSIIDNTELSAMPGYSVKANPTAFELHPIDLQASSANTVLLRPATGDIQFGQITTDMVAGTISVTKGGTGASNAAGARLNLDAQQTITGGASTIASDNLVSERALISNGSGKVEVSPATSTELSRLVGVTSSVQSQLNSKEPNITILPVVKGGTGSSDATGARTNLDAQQTIIGAASTVTRNNLNINRSVITNANGKIVDSEVTADEIYHLKGATSNIQQQIDSKQPTITTLPVNKGGTGTSNLPAGEILIGGGGGPVDTIDVLPVELGGTNATTPSQARTSLDAQQTVIGAASTVTRNNLIADRALISNGSGKISDYDVTTSELSCLKGIASPIQDQINSKEPNITILPIQKGGTGNSTVEETIISFNLQTKIDGAASTITSSNLDSNRVLTSNNLGKVVASNLNSDVLTHLSTINSNVQNQINGKEPTITTLLASRGGTGNTSYAQGHLLIGNSAGTLTKNRLTAGRGITISNGDGNIVITSAPTIEFVPVNFLTESNANVPLVGANSGLQNPNVPNGNFANWTQRFQGTTGGTPWWTGVKTVTVPDVPANCVGISARIYFNVNATNNNRQEFFVRKDSTENWKSPNDNQTVPGPTTDAIVGAMDRSFCKIVMDPSATDWEAETNITIPIYINKTTNSFQWFVLDARNTGNAAAVPDYLIRIELLGYYIKLP